MVGLKQAVIKHNLAKKHKQAFSQSLTYAWNEKKNSENYLRGKTCVR